MSKRDYYEVLELERGASDEEIKKAYRRMAMKHHPDRNPGDKTAEEKFKEAKEAYEILSDSNRRQAYDQFGHRGAESMGGGGGGSSAGGYSNFNDMFGDIFGDIFGGGGRSSSHSERQHAQAGSDLGYSLSITLEEAVHGATVQIRVPTLVGCTECQGSGARKGSSPVTCETCDGMGQVRMQQGFFSIQQTCPTCHGQGRVIRDPCRVCRGQGRVRETKTLSVKIPAGVDNGDRIRLSGEGEAGLNGGPTGDLYVDIKVKPHVIFERDHNDLICEVPVSFVSAAVGGELMVPTLEGQVKLKLPPETQSGKAFRLRGKGVKSVRGGSVGDLICRVVVETPVNLNLEQKELLRQFDESLAKGKHSPKLSGWFEGVKKFFGELRS